MLRDYYKQMSDELKKIKKEGKVENIEIEEMNEENGYEDVEINYPQNKKFKTSMLKKGIIATAAAVCLGTGLSSVPVPEDNVQVVEAATKKDKKKPVIKFSGKSKMTVEKNKSVKIPKTTAKDNKDGNVTKKLKVTVKKGKKSYSKIAKAIKSNKKVKFTSTGKYVITYTVTDKAGNKATKKRYVTVVNKNSNDYNLTTEEKTTEEQTTETPTTEAPTTETPTTEEQTNEYVADLSKFCDYKEVNVNGYTYNVATKLNVIPVTDVDDFEFKYDSVGVIPFSYGIGKNSKYNNVDNLFYYFIGDFKVINNGKDVSKNVIYLSEKKVMSTGVEIEYIKTYVVGIDNKLHIYGIYSLYKGDYETVRGMALATCPNIDYIENYVSEDAENEFIISPSPKQKEFDFNNEYTLKLEK